ncbi:hypothetical protein JTB14_016146 [Gonioctena quinquepunctata]|nr:hypothetical protein JTB14_016146 [Gonioctena quinquepunctata]
MYRVNLALFHVKLTIAQRGFTALQTGRAYFTEIIPDEQLVAAVKPLVLVPDQISSLLNAVGHVKTNETLYVPKIGRVNQTRRGLLILQSEQVTYVVAVNIDDIALIKNTV